jgi:hypothetical protein
MASLQEITQNFADPNQLIGGGSLGSLGNIIQSEGLLNQPSIQGLAAHLQMQSLPTSLRALLRFAYIPKYEPTFWNDFETHGFTGIQVNNNCYNYACNIPNKTYAQPGTAGGNPYTTIDCVDVGAGAEADGLLTTSCDQGCDALDFAHQVALVIWPGTDFHWYRRDRDGRWSHKLGGTPATNLDKSGNLITDPRTANRGAYTVFCGCYCVRRELVTLAGLRGLAIQTEQQPERDLSAPEAAMADRQLGDRVTVRLLIFSGRPDPEWTIDPQEWTTLFTEARRTGEQERLQAPPPGGLGYRGFQIYRHQAQARLADSVTVYQGVVSERTGTQTFHWRDRSSLEQRLLDQARRQGYGNLLDAVGVGSQE